MYINPQNFLAILDRDVKKFAVEFDGLRMSTILDYSIFIK